VLCGSCSTQPFGVDVDAHCCKSPCTCLSYEIFIFPFFISFGVSDERVGMSSFARMIWAEDERNEMRKDGDGVIQ
jgi:hypothetical protein